MHSYVIVVILLVFHTLGVLTIIDALLSRKRSSQGTIAWIFFLVGIPYISLPVYWILGRTNFGGYMMFRDNMENYLSYLGEEVINKINNVTVNVDESLEILRTPEKLAKTPLFDGNMVDLLVNGDKTFDSIFEGIERALNYVLVQFYIIESDEFGTKFINLLIKKAKEGIRVFVLYDNIASKISKSDIKRMRACGIKIYDFYATKGIKHPFRANFRNHRKIVVVDGRTCWLGGHNVSNDYIGKGKLGFWRDTHVRIEGPSALAAQLSFTEDWHWVTKNIEELNWDPYIVNGKNLVLIVPTSPADKFAAAQITFLHLINSAKERVWIASPYFVPDEAMIKALQCAAVRGVDVRVIIPNKQDHFLVYNAAYAYLEEAMKIGVKFYRYKIGFMHQKIVLVDKETATVGTLNFDNRSFHLNFEISSIIHNHEFATKIDMMLKEDMDNSMLMTLDDLKLSPLEIIKSQFSYLFAPVL